MSLIDGKYTGGTADDFERLKLVSTLATMIYADPSSSTTFAIAVARARAILSAADDSLQRIPNLRLNYEESK